MAVPAKIPILQNPVIASYSYTDIASGLGYEEFNGFADSSNTSITFDDTITLSSLSPYTSVKTTASLNNYDATHYTAVYAETPAFNSTRTVKGKALIYFCARGYCTGGGSTRSFTMTATVYKNSTSIGSATTDTFKTASPGGTWVGNGLVTVDLTETTIKKGDTLKIYLHINVSGGVNGDGGEIIFDPQNGDIASGGGFTTVSAATYPTILKAYIPFRIDQ